MSGSKFGNEGVITGDRYEFRPPPKWKFTEMFTWDWNETKAMFL